MIFCTKVSLEPQTDDLEIPLENPIQALMKKPHIGWTQTTTVYDSETGALHTYEMSGARLSTVIQPELVMPDDLDYMETVRDELTKILARHER